jgi:hypothetical protein
MGCIIQKLNPEPCALYMSFGAKWLMYQFPLILLSHSEGTMLSPSFIGSVCSLYIKNIKLNHKIEVISVESFVSS